MNNIFKSGYGESGYSDIFGYVFGDSYGGFGNGSGDGDGFGFGNQGGRFGFGNGDGADGLYGDRYGNSFGYIDGNRYFKGLKHEY